LRMMATNPASGRVRRRFSRNYFTMHRFDFPREINYTLPYGKWIELFGRNNLWVRRLIEPHPQGRDSLYLTPSEQRWARSWPMEAIWVVQKGTGDTSGRRRRVGATVSFSRAGGRSAGLRHRPRRKGPPSGSARHVRPGSTTPGDRA
jgi:hypothetical protein